MSSVNQMGNRINSSKKRKKGNNRSNIRLTSTITNSHRHTNNNNNFNKSGTSNKQTYKNLRTEEEKPSTVETNLIFVEKAVNIAFQTLLKGVPLERRFIIRYDKKFNTIHIEIRFCSEKLKLSKKWYPHARITLDDLEMHIDTLTSCTPTSVFLTKYKELQQKNSKPMPTNLDKVVSGTIILNGFIDVARMLRIKSVHLIDASKIYFGKEYGTDVCGINFAILSILQNGKSWYQKMGFKERHEKPNSEMSDEDFSEYIKEIDRKREAIPNMKFNELIDGLARKDALQSISLRDTNRLNQLNKNKFNVQFEKLVQERTEMKQRDLATKIKEFSTDNNSIDFNQPVHIVIRRMIESIKKDEESGDTCPLKKNLPDGQTEPIPPKKLEILKEIVKLCSLTSLNDKTPFIVYDHENLVLTLP